MEIQRGKIPMQKLRYNKEHGATCGNVLRSVEHCHNYEIDNDIEDDQQDNFEDNHQRQCIQSKKQIVLGVFDR